LATYCQTWSNYVVQEKAVRREGDIFETESGYLGKNPRLTILKETGAAVHRLAAELGLSPSSRSKVSSIESAEKDPLQEILDRTQNRKRG